MAKVSVTKTISAPAERVWALVSEWGGTHKWIPGVGPVSVEGEGVGSVRSADLDPATGFSGSISERLLAFDDVSMSFQYAAIGESPLPVQDYVATMKVSPSGNGESSVTWSSTWEPLGRPEAEIREIFATLYNISLDNVEKAVGSRGA